MDIPIKYGYGTIPVNIISGIPQCPHCHTNMIEVEKNTWECPIAKLNNDLMVADLLKMFDDTISD